MPALALPAPREWVQAVTQPAEVRNINTFSIRTTPSRPLKEWLESPTFRKTNPEKFLREFAEAKPHEILPLLSQHRLMPTDAIYTALYDIARRYPNPQPPKPPANANRMVNALNLQSYCQIGDSLLELIAKLGEISEDKAHEEITKIQSAVEKELNKRLQNNRSLN